MAHQSRPIPSGKPTPPARWETTVVEVDCEGTRLAAYLNDGWEVVSTEWRADGLRVLFRRRLAT